MSKAMFKHYKFHCQECGEYFEKGMWINSNGEQEPVKCANSDCDNTMGYNSDTQDKRELPQHGSESARINMREKWKSKIPGEFKEWMENDFSKRHGTEQTINMRD